MTETVATRVEELLTETPVKNRTSTEDTEDERGGEREGEGRAEGGVEGEGEDGLFMYRLSLQMISWPHLGRKKEVWTLTCTHTPSLTHPSLTLPHSHPSLTLPHSHPSLTLPHSHPSLTLPHSHPTLTPPLTSLTHTPSLTSHTHTPSLTHPTLTLPHSHPSLTLPHSHPTLTLPHSHIPHSHSLTHISPTHDISQACLLALDNCPIVTVDYCHTMFPNDLDLWAWLLERLLGYTQCDGPLQELYVSLYKGMDYSSCYPPSLPPSLGVPPPTYPPPSLLVIHSSPSLPPLPPTHTEALSHVITLTTPQQFLALLPPTGSVQFFLPFIERSCKLHFSRATSEQLHSSLSQQ